VKYHVTVEVEAADEYEAIDEAVEGSRFLPIQVRQEPFDTPSPMWDVEDYSSDGFLLRRLR
jgi:hypothetical protein